jgi:hypothetical protein
MYEQEIESPTAANTWGGILLGLLNLAAPWMSGLALEEPLGVPFDYLERASL